MKLIHHPDRDAIALENVLYALGDPVRLEIVKRLANQGEQPCSSLDCKIAKSTMSNHFRILRESGVIYSRREGTQYINTLRLEDLEARFPGLMTVVLQSLSSTT